MDFGFSEKEEKLRQEVRQFLAKEIPPDWLKTGATSYAQIDTAEEEAFAQAMARKYAEKGWVSWSWPERYGGRAGTKMEHTIIQEEILYRGAPGLCLVNTGHIGPTMLELGTEEQKRAHLTRMARGETFWANGLSEPNAGSDIANIATTAIEEGDSFIINGQKCWGTEGYFADWIFFLARTDPDSTRHRGISMLVADLKTPGITRRVVNSMDGYRFWVETHFDNARIPRENLIGEKNNGWNSAMTCLNNERSVIGITSTTRRNLDLIIRYARETKRGGQALAEDPLIRHKLADLAVRVNLARLLCYRIVWMRDRGISPTYETSVNKTFAGDTLKLLGDIGMQLMGLCGQLKTGAKWASFAAPLERAYLANRAWLLGAGASEIQRNIIALTSLRMPREPR